MKKRDALNIGDRIKARREELHMSQTDLANKMGYKSRTTIGKIETGVNDVTAPNVVKFAQVLNTTIAYLMGWEDEEEDVPPILPAETLSKRVGKKIAYIRHKRNMTVEELAEATGITPLQVENMEHGANRGFNLDLMKRFCNALDVDDTYFLDMIEPIKHIGENVTALREMNDMSIEELANELGITGELLAKYENDTEQIPFDILDKIAESFNISVNMIIGMSFKARLNDKHFIDVIRILRRAKLWQEAIGDVHLTDEELNKIIEFSKFVISQRK